MEPPSQAADLPSTLFCRTVFQTVLPHPLNVIQPCNRTAGLVMHKIDDEGRNRRPLPFKIAQLRYGSVTSQRRHRAPRVSSHVRILACDGWRGVPARARRHGEG